MRRIPIATLVTAVALVAILLVYMVTFQVRFSENVVKVRLGKTDYEGSLITEPGLYFKWPPPIERTKAYDMRLRTLDTPETEIKTRDEQALIVGCFAVWKIADPLKFYVRVPNEREARDKIRTRINEVRATVFGRHDMSDLFNLDPDLVARNFTMIENEMLAAAAPGILRDFGVELEQVGVRRVALPSEATATVQDAMRKNLERRASRFRTEGRSRAASIKARAEEEQNKIMAFVNRLAQELESEGVEASVRLLQQIQEGDSEFFIWQRFLEALQQALAERGTIFLDWNDVIYPYFSDPQLLLREDRPPAPSPADLPLELQDD